MIWTDYGEIRISTRHHWKDSARLIPEWLCSAITTELGHKIPEKPPEHGNSAGLDPRVEGDPFVQGRFSLFSSSSSY
jgi:hypothetical protein